MKMKKENRNFCLAFAALLIGSAIFFTYFLLPVKAAGAETYTIIFETNGGECEVDSLTVEKGQSMTLPPASYEGHYFKGWLERVWEGDTAVFMVWPVGSSYTPKQDDWLYAVWGEEILITFDAGRGECAQTSLTIRDEEEITLPDAVCEGYEFTGWYKDEGLQEYAGGAGEGYKPGAGMTLYAGWKEKKEEGGDEKDPGGEQECTVAFDTDGGKEIEAVCTVKGAAVQLPDTEKEGFRFLGWYTEKEDGILLGAAGDNMTAEGDMTVYARWEEVRKEDENTGKDDTEKDDAEKDDAGKGDEGKEDTGKDNGGNPDGETGKKEDGGENLPEEIPKDGARYLEMEIRLPDKQAQEEKEKNEGGSVTGGGSSDGNGAGGGAEGHGALEAAAGGKEGREAAAAEPVIQTGRLSMVPAAAVLGIYGVLLVVSALMPGKKRRNGKN